MGSGVQAKFDTTGMIAGLERLRSAALRQHLARSMAVAGGEVLRDEAKAFAPVADGVLKGSIYLAFKEKKSNADQVTYSISWNSKVAPHGHLIEFGHWQPFVVTMKPDGTYVTTKTRLAEPKWIAAHPFLRPAYEGGQGRARDAMVARGRERLPELLAGAES
jgi:HK97 gp10 family phage protein